jgi:nudix-type nucleoside diphosphatase (YffH/AdpP family)
MTHLFFYGTLRHIPLLEAVLGRNAESLRIDDAVLEGFAVSSVAEGPFPMIAIQSGTQAIGIVVNGLDAADIARLDFYEGSFDYDLEDVTLANGVSAQVYVPRAGQWTADGPWSLHDWTATWGKLSLFSAQEVMGYYGQRSRDAVAKMFPRIRARAAAKVNAQQSLHGAGTFHGKVVVDQRQIAYSHYFSIEEVHLRHEKFSGEMSEVVERAVFVGNDAAIVLPYDPVRDCVMLVEQIRMGPLVRGDTSLWQFEPIAGGIDPGETPEAAARRETLEEAGLALGALEKIAEVYASPGNATEFFYVFLGLADLPDNVTGTGGLATEHEDIRSHVVPFDRFIQLVDDFGATNAPLVMAANWLARHRDRLRSENSGATPA